MGLLTKVVWSMTIRVLLLAMGSASLGSSLQLYQMIVPVVAGNS